MQETRRLILDILRRRSHATVDEIVDELQRRRGSITAVTVRHHLMRLQEDGLITSPELKRRSSPGRPQYVYALTEKAKDLFPNNYQRLAASLLTELQKQLPKDSINVILEGVADTMAHEAVVPNLPLVDRLDAVVDYLNQNGYEANWERADDGFLLTTSNCPYHGLGDESGTLCQMDMRLISSLLGIVPRRITHVSDGDATCSYLIPVMTNEH
ncbi:MAG: ArsR family transcriptional regulator [Chloroflexi bacterium]|jgi:predicted ArsR family transcriptional regulator|nr:ArsR family transcriptional regulator [Chloroflexota bacterium]